MITLDQYFGKWINTADATREAKENAEVLLEAVNALKAIAESDGIEFPINPATGSCVSGQTYGGFRPQSCKQGAARSSHKQGLAVDIYDPQNDIDAWCMDNLDKLEQCGIYIEHPSATNHWSHWTIKAPGSRKRVFYP
jgi:hypothetical protein